MKLALQDAHEAIERDDKNMKAYLISGQALAYIGKEEWSISKL